MNRLTGFFLGVIFLGGCAQESSTHSSPGATEKVQEKLVVALVIKTLTNPFFIEMEKGARQAEKEKGFTLKVKSGAQETSIDQQIVIIEGLIAEKVSAIVIAPGSSTELIPVLKKAQSAGIKLVNIDNQLDPAASLKAGLTQVPFISVDNVLGGYLSAKYLADQVRIPSKAFILEGIREAANANQRKAGALKAFGENPLITVVASETANWKIDEGYEVTQGMFKIHKDARLIFAANDMMALGALEYLKEAGLGTVKVAGFDNLDAAVTAIRDGRMEATVDQQAHEQGYYGCVTAMKLLAGEDVPTVVEVEVRLVTKASIGP